MQRDDHTMTPFLSPTVLPAHMDAVRVFLYARQSSARTDGSEVSTESQLAAGHALVASRNMQGGVPWIVVGEYVDKGRSGWDPKVRREDFDRMMGDVRAGEGDVCIVNELSRLTRQGAHDALEIDKEFRAHGVRFMSVLEPFLDTSNPIGVAIFALIAALAKQDSDTKAERLAGAKAQIAALGGIHSSTAVYGMRAIRKQVDNLVISVLEPDADNPDHIEMVERMVAMSFDGVSDNKIATTFEEEKIPAPGMSKRRNTENRMKSITARRMDGSERPIAWRAQTVRWILNHPVIGGFAFERVPRGKSHINVIRRDEAGQPLTPHEGIISGARWLELQEKRKQRSRPEAQPGNANVVPTLLSGWRFLGCQLCAGSMGQSSGFQGRTKVWTETYICANPKGHGGLGIKREDLDDHVARRVWARLNHADMDDEQDREWLAAVAVRYATQKDLAGVAEERRETATHLEHVQQSIKDLQQDRKAGLYKGRDELNTWRATIGQYRKFEEQCTARLAELDEQVSGSIQLPDEWFSGLDPIGEESVWASWSTKEQRDFLSYFLTGVMVGRGRDPETKKIIKTEDRVHFTWVELPKEDDEEDEQELAAV
ncbi:recombinase family protein [Kitasatospora sp. NPDC088351]|uniref:recombinase family protein n=1 Tax=Kitasatospora sp. NPDC088351 TaxID=3155180 RepID=UPI0034338397